MHSLPPDIHRYIASFIPQMVPCLSSVSKQLYANLSPVYNQASLQVPLSGHSFRVLARSKKHNQGLFCLNEGKVSALILTLDREHNYQLQSSHLLLIDDYIRMRDNNYPVAKADLKAILYNCSEDTFDLLTQMELLSQRLGCMKRDPYYARDIVLQQLEAIYQQGVNSSFYEKLKLYLYLYMNIKMRNAKSYLYILSTRYRVDNQGNLTEVLTESDVKILQKIDRDIGSYYTQLSRMIISLGSP